VRADVAQASDVRALVRASIEAWGRLDVAFNNAGIEGPRKDLELLDEVEWDRVLGVNLRGVWLCMKQELEVMRAAKRGVIVNCASIAGLVGFAGMAAYTASKHGVVGLTRAAALEAASWGGRVNALCPGVIDTPMVERAARGDEAFARSLREGAPLGRMGTPEEIAATVLWMSSAGASYLTGQAIAVDGGWTAC
jgi:NAD(P)-dependent dehydrogenase (short-subunit alcohol dehydrogenase family)